MHQAERAFAGVDEEIVEKVLTDICEVAPPDEATHDREQELKLAAMSHFKPDGTCVEATRALHRGFLLENPEAIMDPMHIDELLTDLLNSFEAAAFRQYNQKIKTVSASKTTTFKLRKTRVERYFKKTPGAAGPKSRAKKEKAPRFAMAANMKVPEVTAFLNLHKPDSIIFDADEYNGRWRIICESGEWKSIPWTRRGFAKAVPLALYWAHKLEEEYSGRVADFDMEALAKELADMLDSDDDE
jgi:hypothetical protein